MPIIVKNNKAAYHSVSLVMKMATDSSPSLIETILLKPGNTSVQDKHFDVLVKTPVFIKRRTRGVYTVIEKDVKESDKSDVKNSDNSTQDSDEKITDLDSLKGYSNTKAIEIIKETYDLETLRAWEGDENPKNRKRTPVLKAITEQIENLTEPDEE